MQKVLNDLCIDSTSNLIITPAEELKKIIEEIIDTIKENNIPTIFISLNKPFRTMVETFEKKGINKNLIFFIDCITKDGEMISEKQVQYIEDPSDLTKIGITVEQLMENISGKKTLVIDELKTLLLYNELEILIKFVRSLIGLAPRYNTNICIITTEDEELIESIIGIFDKVIRIDAPQKIKHLK